MIRHFSGGAKKYFITAAAASLITTTLNSLTPQIFRFSIDSVIGGGGYAFLAEHLWALALALIAVAVLSGVSQYVFRANASRAGENFAKNMRDVLFMHVQKLPMSWHDANQTGDIIQRCTSDVEVIRNFVVNQLLEVFRTVFLVAISFGMMLSMNAGLSLVVLCFIPVIVAYSTVFFRLTAKQFVVADEAEGELSTVVQENATGVRVVRAFGREKYEMERFQEKNDAFARLWIRLGTLSGAYWGIGDLITGLQVVAVIVLGAADAVHGVLSVGEFIAFASYNTTLVWPIRGLGRILSDMSKAGVSFERIDHIIRSAEENYNTAPQESSSSLHTTWDIRFSHVSFSYEQGGEVLHDVSFSVPEGSTFGILGGTGSGKSTVVQLLTRLYELPEAGHIYIGGRDIRDIPLTELRRKVGMALQEPFLYSRTIRENISAANPSASGEEIRRAARIACIDDAIMSFPDGYDTVVGERGVTLSGGQRQRVAIARMLLQKAPVMIFDDSLSAVDSETDQKIRRALKEEMKDATVILISHRITTLMGADRIMVLQKGRIQEMGSHQELIGQNGIYRKIYDIQMNQDDRAQMFSEMPGTETPETEMPESEEEVR